MPFINTRQHLTSLHWRIYFQTAYFCVRVLRFHSISLCSLPIVQGYRSSARYVWGFVCVFAQARRWYELAMKCVRNTFSRAAANHKLICQKHWMLPHLCQIRLCSFPVHRSAAHCTTTKNKKKNKNEKQHRPKCEATYCEMLILILMEWER